MSILRVGGSAGVSMLLISSLFVLPANAASAPTLSPDNDAWVSGVVDVESMPTQRGDKVTSITIDGKPVETSATEGDAILRFGVGTNSIEGRYGSYFEVNNDPNKRIDLDQPEYVNNMYDVVVPNEWLVEGENEIRLQVGTFNTKCGENYDDYEIYDLELITGGPVTASPDNRASYNMGDGSCGSNKTLLQEMTTKFTVEDNPRETVGLEGSFDSRNLPDGSYDLVATTAGGGQASNTLRVNNGDETAPDLSVNDGDVLSGEVLLYDIASEGHAPVAGYQIDGQDLETQISGGAGEASFIFDIGSNSSEARYGNSIVVNGQRIMLTDRDYKSESVRIDFPASYLKQGENTIVFDTGTINAGCGVNHDDFNISNLRVEFPNGSAVGRDLKPSYQMGDGDCGSSSSKLLSADLKFDVEITNGGLSAVLDTTAYADGAHTVTVVTTDGSKLTRNVTFDNNGPTLVRSTPAAGAHLEEQTKLAASFEDISGVDMDSLKVTLDGAPVELGEFIGAGLAEGDHTLVFEIADKLGHRNTVEVKFTSAALPAGSLETSSTHEGGTTHKLNATVVEEGDTEYTTTFHLAKASTPTFASEGTSVNIPETLNPETKGSVDLDAVSASDDTTDRSPAAANTSWQRFDVNVGDVTEGARIQWQGEVDPQREAHLLVWNHEAQEWDELLAKRGSMEQSVLAGDVSAKHVKDGIVNAMVAATDPFADDINAPVDGTFEKPEDYDFSIAHLTDTQYLAEGAAGDYRADNTDLHPQTERDLWYNAYADVWRWVAKNADERKIAYAAHTGDITENHTKVQTDPNMDAQSIREFEIASEIQKIVDETGIPNGVLGGNHDNRMGTDATRYNEYFGPDRYEEVSKAWPETASYGGGWKPGDNENHYDLFSAGGLDFIAVHLSYGIDDEDIRWANDVLGQYADRNALLFSHAYLTTSAEADGRDAPYSNAGGREQARRIVEANPNVVMTISGHHHGVGLNVRRDAGEPGNHFLEMLADYQFYEVPVTHPALADLRANYNDDKTLRFGSSFFRLLQFDVDRGELSINSYSPFLDEFGAHEYDLEQRYDGTEDELRVPVQLSSRSTSLATDSVAVYTASDVVLGEATAKAGETATVTVDFASTEGLPAENGLDVGWFAIARNASGGRIVSAFNVLTVDLAKDEVTEPMKPGRPPHAGKPGRPPHAGKPGRPDHAGKPGKPAHAGKPGVARDNANGKGVATN